MFGRDGSRIGLGGCLVVIVYKQVIVVVSARSQGGNAVRVRFTVGGCYSRRGVCTLERVRKSQ
jgi:hypothetical protein